MSLYKVELSNLQKDLFASTEKVVFVDPNQNKSDIVSKIRFFTDLLRTSVRVYGMSRIQAIQLRDLEFKSPVVIVLQPSLTKDNTPKLKVSRDLWSWYETCRNRGLVRPKNVNLYNKLQYSYCSHLLDVR